MSINTSSAPNSPSPLWIIALFIGLSEVMATVAAITTNGATRLIFAIFAVSFPIGVLIVFVWLLLKYPANLYSPAQYTEQTSIEAYAHSLNRSNQAREMVITNAIAEAVVTARSAESLSSTMSTDDLRDQVIESVDRAVQDASVTVHASLLTDGDEIIQVPVTEETTVDSLLDSIYFSIAPAVKPFTYNQSWLLADENFVPIEDIGTQWARKQGWASDSRSLEEVGIFAGSKLLAIPKSNASRRPTSKRSFQNRLASLVESYEQDIRKTDVTIRKISGPERPRLLVDSGGTQYGLYVMPGSVPTRSWIQLARDAARNLEGEEGSPIVPVLALRSEPSSFLEDYETPDDVKIIWRGRSGIENAPWAKRAVRALPEARKPNEQN